ncbi:hypothetical protein GJA_213 [Janthinobacterium agaricidamnosum NBRC 102515 = DSM 9628]|uniref:Uncharacterized protein n=1 Tax=Janthinobacterium agaricidamnosum NBRC 102515 = DSM 9628 TaxID=1349767 RepID=W0UZ11_9BURK|nr:hypothetical protein GJA_213 [Janthinobacterium agaricidamnosum NBRC 102515 = DSM 9628]
MIFYLVIVGVFSLSYFVLKNMIIKPANRDGTLEYIGIYLAVTGKLPTQLVNNNIEKKRMVELACDGYHELWKYRFSSINDAEVDGGSGSGKYILQGGDKIFFLLGSEGSSIYSFGSKNFVLNEAYPRKYSDLVKDCKD